MSHDEAVTPQLQAAIDLWEHLAAFAWEQSLTLGRGVVVVRENELLAARDDRHAGREVQLAPGYVPMLDVPSGDDFLKIIAEYDVKKQIVLLVGRAGAEGAEDDEQLFVLEAGENGRPLPHDCYFALNRDGSA